MSWFKIFSVVFVAIWTWSCGFSPGDTFDNSVSLGSTKPGQSESAVWYGNKDYTQFPYVGYIRLNKVGGNDTDFCSAVLITKYHLLTAAHCFAAFGDWEAEAVIFTTNGEDANLIPSWKGVGVRRVTLHPNWNGGSGGRRYDVAVVEMKQEVPSKYFYRLPTYYYGMNPQVGDQVWIVGYGQDEAYADGVRKKTLTDIDIVENGVIYVEEQLPGPAGGPHDSGGALIKIFWKGDEMIHELVGIVEGLDFRDGKQYGTYVDGDSVWDWFNDNACVGTDVCCSSSDANPNGNKTLDIYDLVTIAANYSTTWDHETERYTAKRRADVDGDHVVNIRDLIFVAGYDNYHRRPKYRCTSRFSWLGQEGGSQGSGSNSADIVATSNVDCNGYSFTVENTGGYTVELEFQSQQYVQDLDIVVLEDNVVTESIGPYQPPQVFSYSWNNAYFGSINRAANMLADGDGVSGIIEEDLDCSAGPKTLNVAMSPDVTWGNPGETYLFTAEYNDANGANNIRYADILLSPDGGNTTGTIAARYNVQNNTLQINNPSTNDAFRAGTIIPGDSSELSHSLGTLYADQSSVQTNGNQLLVTFAIMPTIQISGKAHKIYLKVEDLQGHISYWHPHRDFGVNGLAPPRN